MSTLEDVARRAGVSKSTVSRALSRPNLVNEATLKRVQLSAQALDYLTSRPARRPKLGALAIIAPGLQLPFFATILSAAQAEAAARHFPLLIGDSQLEGDPATERELAQAFATRADGIVLSSTRLPDEEIADLAKRVPVVVINREVEGVPSILLTPERGVAEAAAHLHQLGHRNILHMTASMARLSMRLRAEALANAAAELGLEVTQIGPFAPRFEAGVDAAELVISSGCTAVIAVNDLVALGLMVRASELGVKIGQDLSVIGFDNIWMHRLVNPGLTTVASLTDRAGRMAVRTLLDRIDGREVPPVTLLPSSLLVRSSTGTVPK
jgi:DNA-binding LacI/PurR family transcriptional regulator